MNWRNVFLIFHREVLDQLRDRRTLFMVAVLPLLLYPLLGIGTAQMTTLFSEQPRRVVVLGADQLPPESLIDQDRFSVRWFRQPSEQNTLHVITEPALASKPSEEVPPSARDENEISLAEARHLRDLIRERQGIERVLVDRDESSGADARTSDADRLRELQSQIRSEFTRSGIDVLVLIPPDFRQALEQRRQRLIERTAAMDEPAESKCYLVLDSASDKSQIASRRVLDVMQAWEQAILKQQLEESQLPPALTTPLRLSELDIADRNLVSASIWAKIFPALLVMMTLTGAFHPAVDMCAGEKERGTMETLLISHARRTEIVMGKFLSVLLFSMTTAVLNLVSIGMTAAYMASLAVGGASSRLGGLTFPPVNSLAWAVVVLIPLATLFSALCLSLATFARSSKEGQYYLSPLLMVTLGLTTFCISPGTEMQPFFSVMPVIGPGLLLKGLMQANGPDYQTYLYAVPVLVTSAGYSLLALWWAIEQFRSEEILFGEAEQFSLDRWFRQVLRDRQPVPTFSQAVICFVLMLLVQFASWKAIQSTLLGTTIEDQGMFQIRILMLQQVFLIAGPPLVMGGLLTTSLRQTFSLRWPGMTRLVLAAVLAVSLHPLTLELMALTQWFFPPPPPGVVELMKQLKAMNPGLTLLAMAVTPALCEEIAFRGYLLSGFRRSQRAGLGIFLSSFAFGLIHMIPQQVFNAFLLGLVLGLTCVRTGSLYPGVVFHFVYNSLGVLHDRWGSNVPTNHLWGYFFRGEDQLLRYQPALICLLVPTAALLLYLLTRSGTNSAQEISS
ncbi:ABC transporter permease subunit/CPBP intramembrane protease [Schlesneria sp.]|uniref:ABC transporter permease subunit/CPBP intramembrane protease n=1 Tax=Schlesneria sp. TaxID=2762018 RepID=UPI002EEAB064